MMQPFIKQPAQPNIASIVRNPALMTAIEQYLAKQGIHGDSMLIHASPQEALALKLAGGAGTANPTTGLPQFYGAEGGSSPDAGGGGLGSGAGTGDSGTSDSGLGGRQGGTAGDGGGWGGIAGDTGLRGPTDSTGSFASHTGAEGPAGSPTGTPGGASTAGGVGSAYESANADYQNRGFIDRALDFMDPLGFHNMKPVPGQAPTYTGGTYHTGWNPGAALGSLASMAVPGVGGLVAGPLLSHALGAGYTALAGGDIPVGGGASVVPGFGGVPGAAGAAMAANPTGNSTPAPGTGLASAAGAPGMGQPGIGPDRDPRSGMPASAPALGAATFNAAQDNQNNNPQWLQLAKLGVMMNPGGA